MIYDADNRLIASSQSMKRDDAFELNWTERLNAGRVLLYYVNVYFLLFKRLKKKQQLNK